MKNFKNLIIYPYKRALEEIKKDKERIKDSESRGSKVNIYPFMYATYLFLFIISVMYLAVLYLIIGGIFVTPISFIGLVPTIFTTWVFTLIYTKVYPKTKENYLKSVGFYKESK